MNDLEEAIRAIPCNGATLRLRSRTLGEALPDSVVERIIEVVREWEARNSVK